MRAAFAADLVLAAHDISDGGALVALAKMCFATFENARIGARLVPSPLDGRAGDAAFSEACGFIVEATDGARFTALAATHGVEVLELGQTTAAFTLTFGEVERSIDALYETWSAPLRDFYAAGVTAGAA